MGAWLGQLLAGVWLDVEFCNFATAKPSRWTRDASGSSFDPELLPAAGIKLGNGDAVPPAYQQLVSFAVS
jgi:hypothetical protein